MHEHEQDDPEVLSEIEKLGYDPRDVPVEKTWIHGVMLFVSFFAVMGLAWIFMAIIDRTQVGPQSAVDRRLTPKEPFPLLQSNLTAKTDIKDLRHKEQVKTDTYGWVDKGKGVAHIPVEAAKNLILSEGMPSTAAQRAPASVTGNDPMTSRPIVAPLREGSL